MLEVLAVLTVMALAAGVVLPRVSTLMESFGAERRRGAVLEAVAGLGRQVLLSGRPAVLAETGMAGAVLPLPEGWRVSAPRPVVWRFDGVCSGGMLALDEGRGPRFWRLEPPLCRPQPR